MNEAPVESRELPALDERLREHSAYLARLAEEVQSLPAIWPVGDDLPAAETGNSTDGDADPVSLAQQIAADVEIALKLLNEQTEAQRQVEETWSRLEDGTAKSARSVPAPRLSARKYPEYGDGHSQVDLRL